MTCKYAFENGYKKAMDKVKEELDLKMTENLNPHHYSFVGTSEYWRQIGRQDIILHMSGKLFEWVNSHD